MFKGRGPASQIILQRKLSNYSNKFSRSLVISSKGKNSRYLKLPAQIPRCLKLSAQIPRYLKLPGKIPRYLKLPTQLKLFLSLVTLRIIGVPLKIYLSILVSFLTGKNNLSSCGAVFKRCLVHLDILLIRTSSNSNSLTL